MTMLLSASAPAACARRVNDYTISDQVGSTAGGMPDCFDVTRRVVDSVRVGDACYRLRSPCRAFFFPRAFPESCELIVDGFGRRFIGEGPTIDAALRDWRERVHVAFQELLFKRPFEMTEDEAAAWKTLSDQIDVPVYKNNTPLLVRQVGKVARARPEPEFIQWENGTGETVGLEQMPPEFAAFKPGQWFRAIIARDPIDFSLLKGVYVRRMPTPQPLSHGAVQAMWDKMPTTAGLPDARWE